MRKIININVSSEYIQGAGIVVGAAGSHNDVILRIKFSEEWSNLSKYATFKNSRGENPVVVVFSTNCLVEGEIDVYDIKIPATVKEFQGLIPLTITGFEVINGNEEKDAKNTTTGYFRVLPAQSVLADDMSIDATLAQQLRSEIDNIKVNISSVFTAAAACDAKMTQTYQYNEEALQSKETAGGHALSASESAKSASQASAKAIESAQSAEKSAQEASETVKDKVDKGEGFYDCYITGGSVDGQLQVYQDGWTIRTPNNIVQYFYYNGEVYPIGTQNDFGMGSIALSTNTFDGDCTCYYTFNTTGLVFRIVQYEENLREDDIIIVKTVFNPPVEGPPSIASCETTQFEPTKSVPTMTEAVKEYRTMDVSRNIPNNSIVGQQIALSTIVSANVDEGGIATIQTGTWTPELKGETTDPTVTTSRCTGWFYRIGKLVYACGTIWISSLSGGEGRLILKGLPFTPPAPYKTGYEGYPIDTSNFQSSLTQYDRLKLFEIVNGGFCISGVKPGGTAEHIQVSNLTSLKGVQIAVLYRIQ